MSHPKLAVGLQSPTGDFSMATVLSGKYKDRTVCVLVEYADGWCVVDLGGEDLLDTIEISRLRLWIPVKSAGPGPGEYEPLVETLDLQAAAFAAAVANYQVAQLQMTDAVRTTCWDLIKDGYCSGCGRALPPGIQCHCENDE